jgi:hypothetical protein
MYRESEFRIKCRVRMKLCIGLGYVQLQFMLLLALFC